LDTPTSSKLLQKWDVVKTGSENLEKSSIFNIIKGSSFSMSRYKELISSFDKGLSPLAFDMSYWVSKADFC
jgi:hypothetical protein